MGDDGSHHSSEYVGDTEDQEVQSPLKQQTEDAPGTKEKPVTGQVGS